MVELKSGNTDMADCNLRVHDMLALCGAMLKVSSYGSALSKELAQVCIKACETCAKACYAHHAHWTHGMHLECKACYEACLLCINACKSI